jgi:5-methylcytosine-specific restriction endonuclease McrA
MKNSKKRQGGSCTIPGCDLPSHSRGWCKKHYDRWKNHGDPNWERDPTCKIRSCNQLRRPGKGYCVEHYAERKQKWDNAGYQLHKEKRLQHEAERRTKPEVKARKAAHSKTYAPRWRAENNEKAKFGYRRDAQRRRAKELQIVGFFTEEQLQARINLYGRRCYLPWCGHCDWDALPSRNRTIDHVIPVSRGGSNWPANLRPACQSCNSIKKAKSLADLGLAVQKGEKS